MENQNSSLFDLGIDDVGQTHLISIAKWNKFLAWVNIVLCSLGLFFVIFNGGNFISRVLGVSSNSGYGYNDNIRSVVTGGVILYAVIIIIYVIPNFFRLNFANKMLKAIGTNDQQLLNESLGHLKTYNKYWGILTIIFIAIYGIIFLLAIIGSTIR